MEAVAMFEGMAARVGTFEATGPVVFGANPSIRGIKSLPCRITVR